jgi:ABC-2 type transport system permease protein
MLEFAQYEGRHRVRGSLIMSGGIAALTALYVWMFPSVEASGVDLDAYVEAFPSALVEAFGIRSLGTIEGFLAAELYAFVWVLLLGLYLAYSAATTVAGEVEDGRMDMRLSLPVSRRRIVGEKFLSLLVPIVVVNVLTPIVVYLGVVLVGKSIAPADLVTVHALSIPYLLSCAALGLALSVAVDREGRAQRAALGLIFGLFMIESVVGGTGLEPVGGLSPTRYYEPSAILVDGHYDLAGAAILLGATVAIVLASQWWFGRKSLE